MSDFGEEGAKFVLAPRPQGYGPALEKAWSALDEQTDEGVANRKGAKVSPDGRLCVNMLGDEFRVDRASRSVTWRKGSAPKPSARYATGKAKDPRGRKPILGAQPLGREAPPFFTVLILHYLTDLSSARPSGEWISFRELEGGDFYFPAFAARTTQRLRSMFAGKEKAFLQVAGKLGGEPMDFGDAAAKFRVLPNIVIALVLHEACEDFPNEANVLFDSTCKKILPTEDLAVAASLLVSKVCKSL